MAIATARILTVADAVVMRVNALDTGSIQPGAAAVRGVSFGFTDAELNTLRIIVRPDDYEGENGNGDLINQLYKIEIGVLRMVKKTQVATDPLINLICAIARLFPKQSSLLISGDEFLIDDNRFTAFYLRNPDMMDSEDTNVRFDSRLLVTFKEIDRAKSEAT